LSIKDRGIIKWTPAAFLPEQGTLMKRLFRDDEKIPRPSLDECEIEVINQQLVESFENKTPVIFKVFKDGHIVTSETVCILKIDAIEQKIKVKNTTEYIYLIDFIDIIGLEVIIDDFPSK
jgi:hypothetical protein